MSVKEITKEELMKCQSALTVGRLKEFLEKSNLPDDSPVLIQRVEDYYYESCDWGVYVKRAEHYYDMKEHDHTLTEDELFKYKEQYHPAFSCVKYNDEDDILFIDLHY